MGHSGVVGVCSGEVRQQDTRHSRGACHRRQGSRFNLEDVISHLPERDASLSWVYASDGVPTQSMHSVYDRNASGCLTMRPLSMTFGMKTICLQRHSAGTAPPWITRLHASNKNWDPTTPTHMWILYGIQSGPGADSFFVSIKSSKLTFNDFPFNIAKSSLNVIENGLVVVVPLALDAWLKILATVSTLPHAWLISILKVMTVFIGNCMETKHRFLGIPCAKT